MGIFSNIDRTKILLPVARAISNQPMTVECDFLEVTGITVEADGETLMRVRVASGSVKFHEAKTLLSLPEKEPDALQEQPRKELNGKLR